MSNSPKHSKRDWSQEILEAPMQVAEMGRLKDARTMIEELGLEKALFPLARAIDYLQTGDESLIEKLSPEVRGIVEEVVAKLKATSQAGS
jgi:hypothetical protein